ncbi:hypothetical protein AOLI_G00306430 [Acnodon oligacanthus]
MSAESSSPRQLLERCHRLVTHSQFIKAWPPVLRSVHQAHLCHSGEASDSLSWTGNGTTAFYSRALATQSDGLKVGLHGKITLTGFGVMWLKMFEQLSKPSILHETEC